MAAVLTLNNNNINIIRDNDDGSSCNVDGGGDGVGDSEKALKIKRLFSLFFVMS